jgi:hypothetical protein
MKKVFLLVFSFLILVSLLVALVTHVSQVTGQLIVQTNDPTDKLSLITLSPAKTVAIGVGTHIETSVASGQYILKATDQGKISESIITVVPNSHITINLSLNSLGKSALVANYAAQDMSISGTDIKFLNTTLQQINEYNFSSGIEQAIATDLYPVDNLLWINHQSGIAIDDIGNPHLITGQNDSALPITTTQTNNPAVQDFTVNPTGDFAYAQGGKIYLSRQGKLAVLGTNNSAEIQVRLANDDTMFVNGVNPTNPNVSTIDVGVPTKSTAYFISTTGQRITYSDSATIDDARWSPDSQTIAISSDHDLSIYNYLTKKSSLVTLQAIQSPTSFNWIDATHLVYVNSGTIWEYDLTKNASYKLIQSPGTINHEAPFTVADTGKVYFSTDTTNPLGVGASIYNLSF